MVIFFFFLSGNTSQYFPQYKLYPARVCLTLIDCCACLHFKMCLQLHQDCLQVLHLHSTDGKLEKLRHPAKPAFSKTMADMGQ